MTWDKTTDTPNRARLSRVSVDAVKQAVTHRITSGIHPIGSRLPPVRNLANELGANRNTVNKAYRQLCDAGVIELSPGRKSFHVGQHPAQAGIAEQLTNQASQLVWQGMAAGIPRDQMMSNLASVVDAVYGARRLSIVFIECNAFESNELATDLSQLTGEHIDAWVLDDAIAQARRLGKRCDLVVTTFHHLAEVTSAFAHVADKVVGLDTRPNHETLLGIARITSSSVGVVCTQANTARTLQHVVNSYHPNLAVNIGLIDQPANVKGVARASERTVVTRNCVAPFLALTGKHPDVVVDFRIDDQSVNYLKQRIRKAQMHQRAPAMSVGV
jgi:GntR family transcriptional regulator